MKNFHANSSKSSGISSWAGNKTMKSDDFDENNKLFENGLISTCGRFFNQQTIIFWRNSSLLVLWG